MISLVRAPRAAILSAMKQLSDLPWPESIIRVMLLQLAAALMLLPRPVQEPVSPANGKGVCPASPVASSIELSRRDIPTPPAPGVHYVGTVSVLVSLSDTGFVCAVTVVKGIDETLNREAVTAIRPQVFQPIQIDGKPVSGLMMIHRDYWRGDDAADLLIAENAGATPDEIANVASAADLTEVMSSCHIDGDSYRNDFFGLSFVAAGSELSTPPVSENRGVGIRLVDAIPSRPHSSGGYTLSLFADPLSKYPNLKSDSQYLTIRGFPFQSTGAKKIRDDFPFLISGVQFMGAIWKNPQVDNRFVGIFTTDRKGFFLSIEITAGSEQQILKAASSIRFAAK